MTTTAKQQVLDRWQYGAVDSQGVWHSGRSWFCIEALGLQMTKFREEGLDWTGVEMQNGQNLAWWLAPRGCGKSETGTIADITWEIVFNINLGSLLVGESRDLAALMLNQVKANLESDLIREFFGELIGDKWATYTINRRGRKPRKEYTVECVGLSGSVVGRHVDNIWCDDVVSLNNVKTKTVRDSIKNWWEMVLLPTLNPGGIMKGRGTRYHPDDLYGYIKAKFPLAMLVHAAIILGEDGTERSFFPRLFPLKWLQDKRERAPVAFAYQYQNETSTQSTDIIHPHIIEFFDKKPSIPAEAFLQWYAFLGVDLAASEKQTADLTACCVTLYHIPTDTTYIIELWQARIGSLNEQIRRVVQTYRRVNAFCRVKRISVENNAYQSIFASTMVTEFKGIPIESFNQQKDKILHLQMHSGYINAGKVKAHTSCSELVDKLEKFPYISGNDDDVDAFLISLSANDALMHWQEDMVGFDLDITDLPERGESKFTSIIATAHRRIGRDFLQDSDTHDKLFGIGR